VKSCFEEYSKSGPSRDDFHLFIVIASFEEYQNIAGSDLSFLPRSTSLFFVGRIEEVD
jgi:hypothetical protein